LFHACQRMCGALCGGSSCGCNSEVYWSEWHNDPPRCCDPCNRCGQWTGPSAGCGCGGCGGCSDCGPSGCGCNGGYSGPYEEGYGSDTYYSGRRSATPHGGTSFAANQPRKAPAKTSTARASTGYSPNMAHNTSNPYTRARLAREAQPILTQPPQSRR
jgi:hypothetical protein